LLKSTKFYAVLREKSKEKLKIEGERGREKGCELVTNSYVLFSAGAKPKNSRTVVIAYILEKGRIIFE